MTPDNQKIAMLFVKFLRAICSSKQPRPAVAEIVIHSSDGSTQTHLIAYLTVESKFGSSIIDVCCVIPQNTVSLQPVQAMPYLTMKHFPSQGLCASSERHQFWPDLVGFSMGDAAYPKA